MQVTYFWIGLMIILLVLDLRGINSVWPSDNSTVSKAGWTALVLALPLVGVAMWGIAGPRGITEGPSSPEHSKG
ncbi:hypothetical protein LVW35_15450 [Pseudomonas sp. HN11]|uniref:hypothetical protein n=1 Tax=Pseudomonas sp. HN11 TaxID=1344094 RepID=UPI001F214E04|nr:hypothetical protein [Pseudomonas sp. HN11]UII69088.1 hypothetical protein LVW35_15450 [Pseudomonas sp. HN11]